MKDFTFNLLADYLSEATDDMEKFRNDSMELIRAEAIERNIQFDGYYRTRWEIEADNVMTFDSNYFEDPQRRDLYVFLAALVNHDIYHFLEYIWPLVYDEDITENYVHREIYLLKEKGVKF